MNRLSLVLLSIWILRLDATAQQLVAWPGGDICTSEQLDYDLVFEDQFDGDRLDTTVWQRYLPCPYASGDSCLWSRTHCLEKDCNEVQIYRDDNVTVSDGLCHLAVRKEKTKWQGVKRKYTSGMIYSKAAYRRYGRYEIRCDIPDGNAYWPAFWVYGSTTEIDIAEYGGDTDRYQIGVHKWLHRGSLDPYLDEVVSTKELTKGMHVYAVEYEPYRTKFYLDDELVRVLHKYSTLDGKPVRDCGYLAPQILIENYPYPKAGNPLHIIVNVALWYWADKRRFDFESDTLRIDYIRYYERAYPCLYSNEVLTITKDTDITWPRTFRNVVVTDGATLTLRAPDFHFDSAGSIDILAGGTVILQGTTLSSCEESIPWRGITVRQGGSLQLEKATLTSATEAIRLPSGAGSQTLVSDGKSQITNSQVGISVSASADTLHLSDTLTIAHCSTALQTLGTKVPHSPLLQLIDNDTIHVTGTPAEATYAPWQQVLVDVQRPLGSRSIPTTAPVWTSDELQTGVLELLLFMRRSLP